MILTRQNKHKDSFEQLGRTCDLFFCLQVVQTVETVNFPLLQTVETVNFHRIDLEGALRQKVNDGKEG